MNNGNISSDTEHEKASDLPVEEMGTTPIVDKMTERRLMRKLDRYVLSQCRISSLTGDLVSTPAAVKRGLEPVNDTGYSLASFQRGPPATLSSYLTD